MTATTSASLPDPDDIIMGSGVPSAKFRTVGTSVTGVIERKPEVQQRTDFDTGEPLFWPDGKPQVQVKVVLATDLRDPEITDDDGLRAIYLKSALLKAVQAAVRAAGEKGLRPGGTLSVTYSADGVAQGRKNPPKLFTASYTPPDPLAQAADAETNTAQQPIDDDTCPAGVDPATWALLTPQQKAQVRAAKAQAEKNTAA